MEFEELRELMIRDRSIRRFDADFAISDETLEKLVELTRYCASGRNLQPLRYRTVSNPTELNDMDRLVKWAGYLPDWDGPEKDERPTAYLVQCIDTELTTNCMCDDGLQLQAITLGATAMGLGCCIIKSFNKEGIMTALNLPERYQPLYVVAIGKPVEKVVIEDTDGATDADIKYYRTPDNHSHEALHHVPKRPLSELLI